VTHEFFGMGSVVPEAKEAVRQSAADLVNGFKAGAVGTSGKKER